MTPHDTSQATHSIAQLTALSGVPSHTLRWYERIGLLEGVPRDSAGRRRYRVQHARRLQLISDLQAAGMTLAEISDYLDHARSGRTSATRQALWGQRSKVLDELGRLRAALGRIDDLLSGGESSDSDQHGGEPTRVRRATPA